MDLIQARHTRNHHRVRRRHTGGHFDILFDLIVGANGPTLKRQFSLPIQVLKKCFQAWCLQVFFVHRNHGGAMGIKCGSKFLFRMVAKISRQNAAITTRRVDT